jgi:hypothetical protein
MPMPSARICVGKISDSTTQVAMLRNVCIDPTKATTSTRITQGRAGCPSGRATDAMPMRKWQTVVSENPMIRVVRRLIRSMFMIAMTPPTTAMTPGAMLAMSAADARNPDSMRTVWP